ncbi:hypothetical protein HanRHA438_Chr16g0750541 [Helianthus annuus]|nr:hypothetical protein HanIR_Chr16g0802581 [Helianthus annuus]KAJ0835038.1 hypothetical protein HanRHA438_Chr16g0750541 [Helianthus annuus]
MASFEVYVYLSKAGWSTDDLSTSQFDPSTIQPVFGINTNTLSFATQEREHKCVQESDRRFESSPGEITT